MICGVVATSISGCGVCNVCRVVCDYSPIGPKHVGANMRYFNRPF
jgi:hypothetical protein